MMKPTEYQPTIANKLISIDGPDGVGKDTLAQILAQRIQSQTSEEVIITSPNLFTDSDRAKKLGDKFVKLGGYSMPPNRINKFYLAAFNRNTIDIVIPALNRGAWVIETSSDLRPIAFTMAERPQMVATYTQDVLRSGILNKGILPKHRILLTAEPSSLNHRLKKRGDNSADDPHDTEGCQKRITAYEQATSFVKKEILGQTNKKTKWKQLAIENVENEQIETYMNTIANSLTQWVLTPFFD